METRHQSPITVTRVVGGVRHGWRHATDRRVAVEVDAREVRVLTRWRHLAFVESWEALLTDLVEVQALGVPGRDATGVGLTRRGDDHATVVWSDDAARLLDALAARGVAVNRHVARFRFLTGRW